MSLALDLTPEERQQLASLLESARAASLGELFGHWEALVRAVERGYDDNVYEYTNDLSVRDRLQSLVAGSSPALRAKLVGALAPIDERFAVATEPAARPLCADPGDLASWWRRVPTRRKGELANDLDAMGYTAELVGYVGTAGLHDGRIASIDQAGSAVEVGVVGADGESYILRFSDVESIEARNAIGMLLYGVAEQQAVPPLRQFVFVNWDEEDDATLTIAALAFEWS
jgi:hypothetical protein